MKPRQARRSGKLLALAAAALLSSAAAGQSASVVDAAGRQRMLSQRIVKAYCQVGLGVLPADSRAQLAEAVALFERQLAVLQSSARGAEAREALRALGQAWSGLRSLATGSVDRQKARQLNERADQVLLAAQGATMALQSEDGGSTAPLVNLAGRQRMLSQRLAKIYMLRAWTGEPAAFRAEAEAARAEFAAALAALRASPANTPAIHAELDAVDLQWSWFEMVLALEGNPAYKLLVADASEAIVNSMDRITRMYARLAPEGAA